MNKGLNTNIRVYDKPPMLNTKTVSEANFRLFVHQLRSGIELQLLYNRSIIVDFMQR